MNENNEHQSGDHFDAPPKLVAALRNVSRPEIFVPPYVDRAILKAARRYFHEEVKPHRFFNPWMLWPALAAACALIICVTRLLTTSSQSHYAREDINHDGKVDILDSFALARELKSGKRLPIAYDVNGDGVVDERDVLLIATHAVQLNKDNGS